MTVMPNRAFSRHEMLPAIKPPLRDTGLMRWMRENLFSTPLNTALSLLGAIAVLYLANLALPWLMNSIWNAASRAECRAILDARGASEGACWGVVKARWHQYIFGFYPPEYYWRPVVTAGLLITAVAPILFWGDRKSSWMAGFASLATLFALLGVGAPWPVFALAACATAMIALLRPQKLILATALFPFLSIWLIWGGAVWPMLNTMVAVALVWLVAKLYAATPAGRLSDLFALVIALAAAIVAATIIGYADAISADFLRRFGDTPFWNMPFAEAGFIGQLVGWLIGAVVWSALSVLWLLLLAMRAVSFVLNLGLPSLGLRANGASLATFGAGLTGVFVFQAARRKSALIGALSGLLAGGLWLQLAAPLINPALTAQMSLGLAPVSSDQIGGFLLALIIGVSAIAVSLPLGILLALGRRSDMFFLRALSVGFIEFIRGVPLITLLFTASLLLQYFLPPQSNFDLILRVIILASLFAAAYLAEVVRGGLAALPRGQFEAADSLGLTFWQAQRLIVMPQALKISIPGIVSTFIGLFKDTTLVSFVGLLDPLRGVTMAVRADINWKGIYWEPYIFVAAIFFVLCFSMSRYSIYLERKLKTDHR